MTPLDISELKIFFNPTYKTINVSDAPCKKINFNTPPKDSIPEYSVLNKNIQKKNKYPTQLQPQRDASLSDSKSSIGQLTRKHTLPFFNPITWTPKQPFPHTSTNDIKKSNSQPELRKHPHSKKIHSSISTGALIEKRDVNVFDPMTLTPTRPSTHTSTNNLKKSNSQPDLKSSIGQLTRKHTLPFFNRITWTPNQPSTHTPTNHLKKSNA
ncbi:MAG: hypothetical protein ACO3K7_04265 [Candidatus Marinamargulisbacteria bacterium]